MHSQFSNILLDLPELNIGQIQKENQEIFIHANPNEYTQPCPVCLSTQTIRRGIAYTRKIRHLSAFGQCVFYYFQPSVYPVVIATLRLYGNMSVWLLKKGTRKHLKLPFLNMWLVRRLSMHLKLQTLQRQLLIGFLNHGWKQKVFAFNRSALKKHKLAIN